MLAYPWSECWPWLGDFWRFFAFVCRWYMCFFESGHFWIPKLGSDYWPRFGVNVVRLLAPEHIYIYIYMPDGCWGDRASSKNGPVRGPPKSRFGDHAFSHYKIGISEEKGGRSKKGQKSQIAPPMGQEVCFVETHTHLNLCTGQLGAKPLRQGVALIKIRFFEFHFVQGLFACTSLKTFV